MSEVKDVLVQTQDLPWQPWGPGTWIKVLHVHEETGAWTALVKLEPGSVFTRHFHKAAVDFYCIEGLVEYRAGSITGGGFAYEPLGMFHESTNTTVETLVFAHFFGPIEFMDDGDNVIFILDWTWAKERLRATEVVPLMAAAPEMSEARETAVTT